MSDGPETRPFEAPGLLRAAALCALGAAAGVVVAQLILEPMIPVPAAGLTGLRVQPLFRAQESVILGQVFLMFLALAGVAAAAVHRRPGLIAFGFLCFLLWQVLEIVPRAIDLFAASLEWAPRALEAVDAAERDRWTTVLLVWDDAWGALGTVRRLVWGLGHLLFGVAFLRERDLLGRLLAFWFLFNAARLLPRTLGALLGSTPLTSWFTGRWWFVIGMVPLFALLCVWLWREAGASRRRPLRGEGIAAG